MSRVGIRSAFPNALYFLRAPLILGAVAFLAVSLVFQLPYTYVLEMENVPDRALLGNDIFNTDTLDGHTFRWTGRNGEITLPALTSGEWKMQLVLDGWQPERPATVRFFANGQRIANFRTTGAPETRQANFQITAFDGDGQLEIRSSVFKPSEFGSPDLRTLGIRIDRLEAAAVGGGLRFPPLSYVLPLTLTVVAVSATLQRLRFSWWVVVGTGLALTLVFAWVIASYRIFLNAQLIGALGVGLFVCVLFCLLGLPLLARLYRRVGVETSQTALRGLGVILSAAFLIKFVGVLYPLIRIPDLLYHAHRFEGVMAGQMFFLQQAREFSGLETVYPPAFYLFLLPFGAFVDHVLLVQLVPLALQSIGALVLFYLARKQGMGERAALIAVFVYSFAPITFILMAWGTYSNTFSQELFLLALTVWFVAPWQQFRWGAALVLIFLFTVLFLSHASMSAQVAVFGGLLLLGMVVTKQVVWRRVGLTAGILVGALVLAVALFYSDFVGKFQQDLADLWSGRVERTIEFATADGNAIAIVGLGLEDPTSGLLPIPVYTTTEWVTQGIGYFLREGWTYYWGVPVIAAAAGAVLLYRREETRLLGLAVSAALGTMLVFFGIGLILNLYTRYMLFALPFIAVGVGACGAALMARNRLLSVLVWASGFLWVGATVWMWLGRVI